MFRGSLFRVACGVFFAISAFGVRSLGATGKPNVVLIMTDDQGFWDVGVHGNPDIETPVMDRIAREGVSFERFYASPVCTPTRASLMTGRYYARTGAIDTYMGRDTMSSGEITLGQVFQRQGYRTGLFGKWHLGRYMKYHPNHRGFDEFLGFWQYGFINRYDDSDELFHNRQPVIATGYITDVLTDAAISFVRANRNRPFLLYLPYNAPHSPYLVPDPYIEKYLEKGLPLREARIYGMVTRIDENIGRLLEVIGEAGISDRTAVIFMSDNGGVSRHFKAGLRGNKGSVWEGGIRVPFFVRWPEKFPAGVKIEAMAQHIDVFPTLCELIGAPLPSDRKIDGKSLLSLIRNGGSDSLHEHLFHQWCRVRPDANKNWAARNRRYKLANGRLFDLLNDPGEKTDVADRHPEIARELREAFEKWFADVTAGQDYARVAIEVGRADENPVEIDLTWGEPVGEKVKPQYRHYTRDTIDNWSEVGDSVRWKIDVVERGTYEVTLTYGCRPADAGSRFRVSVGDSHLDGTVEATAGRDVYRPVRVGTLELGRGPATLEIKPLSIAGPELMALHKIRLRKLDAKSLKGDVFSREKIIALMNKVNDYTFSHPYPDTPGVTTGRTPLPLARSAERR